MTSKTHSDKTTKTTKPTKPMETKTNWTYWGMYLQYGLEGSIWNIIYLNPVITVLVLFEIIINVANTYAMTVITHNLMKLANPSSNSDDVPILEHLSTEKFIVLLGLILFTSDITKITNRLLRKWSLFYTHRILRRIKYAVIDHINLASSEIRQEYDLNERFEGINQFIWTYENITGTLIETIIKTSRFLTFCSYIVYKEPRLLFGMIIIYAIMWRYIIPHVVQETQYNGKKLWMNAYYDMVITESFNINPLYERLYQSSEKNRELYDKIESLDIDICDIEKIIYDEMSSSSKVVRPNASERYMEILKYYTLKNKGWHDRNDNIQFAQNMVAYMLIIFVFILGLYETAIIILINRSTMFSLLSCYSDIQNCEKNSERQLEKIRKFLNAVDKYLEENKNKIVKQLFTSDEVCKQKIVSLSIKDLKISIPSNKTNESVDSTKSTDTTKSIETDKTSYIEQSPMRYLSLESANISITPHKCLLLDGKTGCGKSMTINALAGLYTGSICKKMCATIGSTNNCETMNIDIEFNQILDARCYIGQMLSDDYKYNSAIHLSLHKLFPGAETIKHVKKFLKDIFALKDSSIPSSLTDTPPLKLSGGELQRYVVASQIWRIIRVQPNIVILDEIDRALDKETAVKVISWIIDNISSYFVIVSHLTEVKQMLFEKNCINQIWTYDEISDHQQIKICTNNVN